MDELHDYVTKLFSQIPETIESEKYKQKITKDMEERYVSLIDIGIPEKETIKIVKGDFGNFKKDLKKGISDFTMKDEKYMERLPKIVV
ncbi:hypothetical protein [Marinilactibacillus kalidii]|uniref:hypothetical protein n=1 Tax=Marinilactibacillus kalidii TaxID=2820274 RepID=UPI001ABE8C04|nr:hypothetical protein [Marinilactibacillus kalidii]